MTLWHEFTGMGAWTYASSIAYFSFLSIVPLIAIFVSLISIVGVDEQDAAGFFAALVPDAFGDFVRGLVGDAFKRSGLAISLSSLVLLWSASKGIKALRGALNAAYGVKETRSGFAVIGISIAVVVILGVLIAAVMYLIFGNSVLSITPEIAYDLQHNTLMIALSPIAVLVVGVLVLGVCYTYLPAGKRRFREQLPGAAIAAVACGVLSFGFNVYIEHFSNITVLYGSIATVALLLIWIYLVSCIIIAGGLVNRLIQASK